MDKYNKFFGNKTQKWFDEKHSDKTIDAKLDISKGNLSGHLKIEEFNNLKELDCSDNQLTKLDIRHCHKLVAIKCSKNKLTSLNITDCSLLNRLNCSNNLLTDFNFKSLNPNKLIELNLKNNDFSARDLACFRQFTNLTKLLISTNTRSSGSE